MPGGQGADQRGTTIKTHEAGTSNWSGLLNTAWQHTSSQATTVSGDYDKYVREFDVADASILNYPSKKYIEISLYNSDELWDAHISRPKSDMHKKHTDIQEGVDIREIHEIESIEGNTVTVKAPILTPLTSDVSVKWIDLSEYCGFEELHIDGGMNKNYVHHEYGRAGVMLRYAAHSWIRNCRFSNVNTGALLGNCYAVSHCWCAC